MLLNFGRTRSPGRSSREIGDSSWTPSSEGPAATHRWTWFGRTPSGALRLIHTLVGSPNSRYVNDRWQKSARRIVGGLRRVIRHRPIAGTMRRKGCTTYFTPAHHSESSAAPERFRYRIATGRSSSLNRIIFGSRRQAALAHNVLKAVLTLNRRINPPGSESTINANVDLREDRPLGMVPAYSSQPRRVSIVSAYILNSEQAL